MLEIQVLKQREVAAKQVSTELIKTLTTCFENVGYWDDLSWLDKQPIYKDLVDFVRVLNGEILEIKLLV
jgi:site-specific DNA recombinase